MPKVGAKKKCAPKGGGKPLKAKGCKGNVKGGDFFPLEQGPTPSVMEPKDITRIHTLPEGNLKTEDDVIAKYNYKMEKQLDAGGFGVIFFAKDTKKNIMTACKRCDLGSDWKDGRIQDMKNELFIMEQVVHLYIVKLFTHFLTSCKETGNRLYIFMELADGGNFAKFCKNKGALDEKSAKLYWAQMLCGINHMHSLGIAHRDIKLQNILLFKNPKSISGDVILLVSDFGLSRIVHHEGAALALNRTICGTPIFMAPEILQRKAYNAFLVDVWALGVTLYIMMTMELPFDFRDQNAAVKKMVAKEWDLPNDKCKSPPTAELKAIMSGMIDPDNKKRLEMSQLITHKWGGAEYKLAQAEAKKLK